MEKMPEFTIGIDVSKDHLDAHCLPGGAAKRVTNDAAGYRQLLQWLPNTAQLARIVFEPTGPYHRALESKLAEQGMPLAKVNPRQARRFAEATGKLAKTDRLDAAMLARMGVVLEPEVRPVVNESLADLQELHAARQALIKDRTAAKNRAKTLQVRLLRRQNAQRLKQIERQLAALDREIAARINAEPALKQRHDILVSIPGISQTTAVSMLCEMPELGTLDQRQAASLAGLAPVTRQSGAWRGRATIRAGRAKLRQAIYMPAMVACRFNPDLKAKYDQLIKAGKPPKVAITAIMRKLIVIANALIRDGRTWTEKSA
jgi:transposase